MSAFRRSAVQTAGRIRSSRPYSSAQHGKTGDQVHHFAGSSTEHGHHSAGPKNESLGAYFFVTLAAVPLSVAAYTLSRPGEDGKPAALTEFINGFYDYKGKYAERNALHTAMAQQAAFDRNLYQSNSGSAHIDLRFPETFNTGSPYNISAGSGARDIETLVAHYEKANADVNEKRAKKLAEKES